MKAHISKLALELLKSKKLLAKTEGVLIGGSYARNKADKDSDIDLLVIYKDKFANEFESIHAKEIIYKKYSFSSIFQSRKNIIFYLKEPDPSVISFLREGVIIYDPKGYLKSYTRKAKLLRIFKNKEWKNESKRRLKERINYNIKKAELAIKNNDQVTATYLLRGIIDETIEKLRMYKGDWLYSQRKSNIRYLRKNLEGKEIWRLFYSANPPLEKNNIKKIIQSLGKFEVNNK